MKARYILNATCFDKKGRVISTGSNFYNKTHPIQAHFAKLAGQPYRTKLHAEIHALLLAKGKDIHTLLVTRYDAQGKPRLAKPCPVCVSAIIAYGVKKVIYTTNEGTEEVTIQ